MTKKMISKIKLSNFKSFKNIELDLKSLNILIGANASGKSNFTSFFKFLRDIVSFGLDNAISIQGGLEFLNNLYVGNSKEIEIEIHLNLPSLVPFNFTSMKKNFILFEIEEIIYRLVININKKQNDYKILEDNVIQKGKFYEASLDKNRKLNKKKFINYGEIGLKNINGLIKLEKLNLPDNIKIDNMYYPFANIFEEKYDLLINYKTQIAIQSINNFLSNIFILDTNPKLSKKGSPITGKLNLEEDGSNLPIVLEQINKNDDKKRKFQNIINDFLPFIEDFKLKKSFDKNLIFELQEIYSKNKYIPSTFISDGTINIICLIIALFFEYNSIIIIEEPEKNIHPNLISKLMEIIKEASNKKQIILTTHSPELLKYIEKDNLFLIERNKNGYSNITNTSNKVEISEFLKNEIGIEELFIKNLL